MNSQFRERGCAPESVFEAAVFARSTRATFVKRTVAVAGGVAAAGAIEPLAALGALKDGDPRPIPAGCPALLAGGERSVRSRATAGDGFRDVDHHRLRRRCCRCRHPGVSARQPGRKLLVRLRHAVHEGPLRRLERPPSAGCVRVRRIDPSRIRGTRQQHPAPRLRTWHRTLRLFLDDPGRGVLREPATGKGGRPLPGHSPPGRRLRRLRQRELLGSAVPRRRAPPRWSVSTSSGRAAATPARSTTPSTASWGTTGPARRRSASGHATSARMSNTAPTPKDSRPQARPASAAKKTASTPRRRPPPVFGIGLATLAIPRTSGSSSKRARSTRMGTVHEGERPGPFHAATPMTVSVAIGSEPRHQLDDPLREIAFGRSLKRTLVTRAFRRLGRCPRRRPQMCPRAAGPDTHRAPATSTSSFPASCW